MVADDRMVKSGTLDSDEFQGSNPCSEILGCVNLNDLIS